MAHKELVVFSVPSLCRPSPTSLPFLQVCNLDVFVPDSFVPFSVSELVVVLVPIESVEESRRSFELEDPERLGAIARDGRKPRMLREPRMS